MSMEIYYTPAEQSQQLTLAEVAERFSRAGLSCKVECDEEQMSWLILDGYESNILASEAGGALVFATFNYVVSVDPPSLAEKVDEVMRDFGFSADEDGDFE